MATLEVLALDEATPQIRAPGAADTYTLPRRTLVGTVTDDGVSMLQVAGNVTISGNTTLGDAAADTTTINGTAVAIPNGLNFDANTLVIDALNNRVGVGKAAPAVPLDVVGEVVATGSVSSGGNIRATTIGSGFRAAEGANAKQGIAVLVAGTLAVANTSVTANSRILLTSNVDGGTPGFLRVSARTAGTSFTILSSSGTDTSTVAFQIFEPA